MLLFILPLLVIVLVLALVVDRRVKSSLQEPLSTTMLALPWILAILPIVLCYGAFYVHGFIVHMVLLLMSLLMSLSGISMSTRICFKRGIYVISAIISVVSGVFVCSYYREVVIRNYGRLS
jgi:hypothetical protein